MEHKADILLVGFSNPTGLESLPGINLFKCNDIKDMLELVISSDFRLIISKFQVNDKNALEINKSLESVKSYYPDNEPKKFKLLISTSSTEEDDICMQNDILYFPEVMNLRSLVLRLIDLPQEPKVTNKDLAIIDFKELFVRVDNNRKFIKDVIEKFFAIKSSRLADIKEPLDKLEYQKAKDAAHKLKGVLANFSMLDARATILELEKAIRNEDQVLALQKLSELTKKIDEAQEFYHNNSEEFKT